MEIVLFLPEALPWKRGAFLYGMKVVEQCEWLSNKTAPNANKRTSEELALEDESGGMSIVRLMILRATVSSFCVKKGSEWTRLIKTFNDSSEVIKVRETNKLSQPDFTTAVWNQEYPPISSKEKSYCPSLPLLRTQKALADIWQFNLLMLTDSLFSQPLAGHSLYLTTPLQTQVKHGLCCQALSRMLYIEKIHTQWQVTGLVSWVKKLRRDTGRAFQDVTLEITRPQRNFGALLVPMLHSNASP